MNHPRLRRFLSLLFSFSLIQGLLAGDSVTFAPFNTGTITRGVTGVTTSLNVTGIPANEFLYASVTGDFVPGAPPLHLYSVNMLMELSDGTSTVYWPASVANHGAREGTNDAQWSGSASLKWAGPLPKTYTGGTPLRVKFFSTAGTDNYTGVMNNVVVALHPTPTPVKTFATYNSGTITGGSSVSQSLDVSGMSGEYCVLQVSGNFVAGANPAWSSTIQMQLGNGGATIHQPYLNATSGKLDNANATTLHWNVLLPVNYAGGALSLSFRDTYSTGGTYTSNLNNISARLFPVSTPTKTFASVNSGTLTGGSSVSQALNVTGTPASDYVLATVTGNFVAGANPAYSNTIQMELNNGGATVYMPQSKPVSGALDNATSTTLKWVAVLPRSYVGGSPLSVKFIDTFNDASGPYTSSINNVVVTLQPSFSAPTTISSLNRVNASPSNASTVNWLLSFPTPVAGVTASNFSLSPTVTGASIGTPTTSNGGLTWNIPVTTGTGSGTLGLNLANTTNLSRPVSTAVPYTGQAYTIDKTAPTIAISAPSATATRTGPVTYTVTYTDTNFSSSTLVTGNITLNTTGTATGTLGVSGTGNTRTVSITSITGDGTLGISIAANTATDTAGNNAPASSGSATFTVDNTAPVINIGAPSATLTRNGSVTYTVTYGDTNFNSSTLATGNITLNTTGNATGTLGVSGTGITRTVTISSIAGDGTLGISIAAGTATDTLGNTASASSASMTFTVDNTAPVITSATTAGGTYQTAFSYLITASGSPTSYSATDYPTGLSFAGATLSGSPTQSGPFSVTVSATDAAGNVGSTTLTLTVAKAAATVSLEGLTQAYDGSARIVTATTVPAGLTVDITYNDSSTAPTSAGSYTVIATINDANRQGTTSSTLEITKVALTVTPIAATRAFGADDPTFGFNITGFVGSDTATVVSGAPAIATTAAAASPPGAYPLTATVGTLAAANYTFTFAPSTLTITKQDPESWNDLHFTEEELQDPEISGPLADADGDGIANLIEMAFGTDPRLNASGPAPLVYTGTFAGNGTLSGTGQPVQLFEAAGDGADFRAVFVRRNPAFNEGLVYTPQFSADMTTWQGSAAIPVVLAVSGDLQIVSVPYPLFVAGKKARFFRISVSLVP